MTPKFALRQRPDAAFETLYRRHVQEVYRYALAVLGSPADAEDVTQTTFMNAYRAFQAGERPRKPRAWLRTIAHNVCKQRFRQAARRPDEVIALEEAAAPEESEGPSAADIARALRMLPFNQRAALVMRELEGRRQAEIAAELDLSVSAVEALLFRARRAMREQLTEGLTCDEAARAISRQLDRSLPRPDRAALRAHLRECEDCASFARQARAQRGAMKKLAAVPLPASLLSWSSGGVAAGVGIGAKVAAGVAAVVMVAGAADVGLHQLDQHPAPQRDRAHAIQKPSTPAASVSPTPAAARTARALPLPAAAAVARPARREALLTERQVRRHGSSRGSSPKPHPAHPATPAAPQAAVKPAHPAKPSHPAHPAHPEHPAKPPKPQHPAHPVYSEHPVKTSKPPQLLPGRGPGVPLP
jgi:RNA polymerase sigma factor (sigma-70 family)